MQSTVEMLTTCGIVTHAVREYLRVSAEILSCIWRDIAVSLLHGAIEVSMISGRCVASVKRRMGSGTSIEERPVGTVAHETGGYGSANNRAHSFTAANGRPGSRVCVQ